MTISPGYKGRSVILKNSALLFFLFFCWRKRSRRAHQAYGRAATSIASLNYAEDERRKIRREFRYKPEQPHHNRGIRRKSSVSRVPAKNLKDVRSGVTLV